MENFWDKIGLKNTGLWQKIKWIIATIIFLIPNLIFYGIYRAGEYSEKLYFEKFMPAMFRWIKK